MTDRDLLDEQMDQRLSVAGARWRDALPLPAEHSSAGATSRPRWLVPAAAAAAVAAVATSIYAVGLGDHPAGPEPADPAQQVVPWKDLPATNPTLPTITLDPATLEECGRGDLRFEGGRRHSEARWQYSTGTFALAGSEPCVIEGFAEAQLLDGGLLSGLSTSRAAPDGPPQPVVVTAFSGAHVTVRVQENVLDCLTVTNDTIVVTLPTGVQAQLPGVGGLCGPDRADIRAEVLPLTSAAGEAGNQRSPYEGVTVGKLGKLAAEPDSTVDFEVTLTSAVDLPLVPCPDYFVHTGATGPDAGRPHGLNCDGVPYRDSQGRPYLPAGTPVTFAMRAPTGPAAALTPIFWDLQAPTLPSGAGTLAYSVRSAQ